MESLEDLYPKAWDVLTADERRAIADEARPSAEVVRKLAWFAVVAHVEWVESPGSGAWIVTERFAEYVRDRLG
jgi:hypothetical protein